MSSILCEPCNTWYHAVCVNIDTSLLSVLERSSCPWECPNCGLPKFSASLFDSVILDSDITVTSSEESPCSTPLPTPLLSSSPSKIMKPIQSHATNLRIVEINFQSVCAKKEEFWCLIDAAKPDVIIGSETWLMPEISDSEIFPPGYHVYRKDRAGGHGGVLLDISTNLISNKVEIETEGEFVVAKVLSSKHAIIFAAAYRPPRSDQTYMDTVNQTLSSLCHKFSNMPIWTGGDMNLPDIEWETEQLTTNQYTHSISYSFLDALVSTGLQQVVKFPTRNNNTLDVILTNCPSLAKQCAGMPDLSDHDIVFVETSSRALRQKPARRMILLWKHATFDNMRLKISIWTRDFISSNTTFTPVEDLAIIITGCLSKIVSDSAPSKSSTSRLEQSWTATLAKRMCRRKSRAFRKARQTKESRDW